MKAEHRKELMTNTLAHRLGDAMQSMKEGPSRGTVFALIAVGLIVILIVVWRYMAASGEEADSTRWLKLDELGSPEQLKAFVENEKVTGHLQGRLARMEEARRALNDGLRQLGTGGDGRKKALDEIQRAAELYDKLAEESTDKPLLHQQVLMGAAKAHESLGDADQAKKYYQQLQQKYGETLIGRDAAAQIKRLEESEQNGDFKKLSDELARPAAP
jgi:tetratricopeptide (TPR) repeat protein